ncbi:hypothetical protein GOP47_0020509 [Adiantum capillus-veneris]|uniref:Uncharacterized protein n=1 Tax=Adiantum capillus-veneris TaxID=13818 RepID=A0A9D4UAX3_ADICA|nr:hypothetical protein GOP47_0020509 [Adiantum capillus-veneris]
MYGQGGGASEEGVMCSGGASDEGFDDELSMLSRHTKVIVIGNNRTKFVLVGLQGVVKKAVGLGGWHWLLQCHDIISHCIILGRSASPYLGNVCFAVLHCLDRKTNIPHTTSVNL